MRVNNTFRTIIDCFWRKHCRDSPYQTSSVVFLSVHTLFFLTRSLIDRCQIVTDTCTNNVSKFDWKPFKSPLSLRKWKCFSEASLFNLHHLYFSYHLLAHKLFSLWKILQFLIITALNHLGSFGKNFVEFKGKNENVIHQPRSVHIEKNCALRGHSFSQ